jgi:hypothetical protein
MAIRRKQHLATPATSGESRVALETKTTHGILLVGKTAGRLWAFAATDAFESYRADLKPRSRKPPSAPATGLSTR